MATCSGPTNASKCLTPRSRFLGGDVRLRYGMTPFGTPRPATVTFKADYGGSRRHSGSVPCCGSADLNLLGRVNGSIDLQWPNAHFDRDARDRPHRAARAGRHGAGARRRCRRCPGRRDGSPCPFDSASGLPSLAMSADVHYTFDPDGITFEPGTAATEWTHIRFGGRTDYGALSDFPFEVTSHDWQESDRVAGGHHESVSAAPHRRGRGRRPRHVRRDA